MYNMVMWFEGFESLKENMICKTYTYLRAQSHADRAKTKIRHNFVKRYCQNEMSLTFSLIVTVQTHGNWESICFK